MPLFGTRRHRGYGARDQAIVTEERRQPRSGWAFRRPRRDRDRVAGGYRAALANPNTTREGRRHAKSELRRMGRADEVHVPFMTKVRRTLGIRSTPRLERERQNRQRRGEPGYRGGGGCFGPYSRRHHDVY